MKSFDIYNLDFGKTPPFKAIKHTQIGIFKLELVDNYDEVHSKLHQGKRHTNTLNISGEGISASNEVKDPKCGEWALTARAVLVGDPDTESIFGVEPVKDSGIWDLITILSFITGRHVATEDMLGIYDPRSKGVFASKNADMLYAAALAWDNRQNIIDKGLRYALYCQVEAYGQKIYNIMASLYTTALDIIASEEKPEWADVDSQIRKDLEIAVNAVIDGESRLTPKQKESYKGLVGGTARRHPLSLHVQTKALLEKYEIIPVDSVGEINKQVRRLNEVRNKAMHEGRVPDLFKDDMEKSARTANVIAAQVIPNINQLVIGRAFGFKIAGTGSMSQYIGDLQAFFAENHWNGWKYEDEDAQDYVMKSPFDDLMNSIKEKGKDES